jgi:hypothetical protein
MEHAGLVAFLTGSTESRAFAREITDEVASCNAAFKSGGIGYIVVTDGLSTVVTREHAKRLLAAVADGSLDFELANYVADGLIMSDDFEFEDDAVTEAIFFLEDDSRPPTAGEVEAARSQLDISLR